MDKKMKKNVNYMAWGLVAYSVLSFGVIVIGLIGYLVWGWMTMPEADKFQMEAVAARIVCAGEDAAVAFTLCCVG